MARVYVETSIFGYLGRRSTNNVVAAARQVLTRRWCDEERARYALVASQFVVDEVGDGDPEAARHRLLRLQGIPLLKIDEKIVRIANRLLDPAVLPPQGSGRRIAHRDRRPPRN